MCVCRGIQRDSNLDFMYIEARERVYEDDVDNAPIVLDVLPI